jgi:RNA polymerase sigma factor (sigma-70 family)
VKSVSNDEFTIAWENKEYQKIISTAIQPFLKNLSLEESIEVRQMGLWEAMRRYEPIKKPKFTSYLYQIIRWQCGRIIYSRKKPKYRTNVKIENYSSNVHKNVPFFELVDGLTNLEEKVVRDRFIENRSLHDIGQRHDISHQTVQNVLKRAYKAMS